MNDRYKCKCGKEGRAIPNGDLIYQLWYDREIGYRHICDWNDVPNILERLESEIESLKDGYRQWGDNANNNCFCGCGGIGMHIHKPWWKSLFGIKHNYEDGWHGERT